MNGKRIINRTNIEAHMIRYSVVFNSVSSHFDIRIDDQITGERSWVLGFISAIEAYKYIRTVLDVAQP